MAVCTAASRERMPRPRSDRVQLYACGLDAGARAPYSARRGWRAARPRAMEPDTDAAACTVPCGLTAGRREPHGRGAPASYGA